MSVASNRIRATIVSYHDDQSKERTLWHLEASTLTASFMRTSGGSCPVPSTVKMK